MAGRFWVGGTGTWDGSTTTHWAASSGGANNQSVPVAGDDVTFDGASGGGTITITTNPTLKSLTTDAFTGTFGNATDNYNMTLSNAFGAGWFDLGSGAHTVNMGLGTWTVSAAEQASCFAVGGGSLTLNRNSSTLIFTGSNSDSRVNLGGATWNNVQFTSAGRWKLTGAGTIANLSVAAGVNLAINAGLTLTLTNAPTLAGTRAAPIIINVDDGGGGATAAISVASGTMSIDWALISLVTAGGGATFNLTNSVVYGSSTTGWTVVSGPSAGGSGSHMIGS